MPAAPAPFLLVDRVADSFQRRTLSGQFVLLPNTFHGRDIERIADKLMFLLFGSDMLLPFLVLGLEIALGLFELLATGRQLFFVFTTLFVAAGRQRIVLGLLLCKRAPQILQ